jgi:hypothetical protein
MKRKRAPRFAAPFAFDANQYGLMGILLRGLDHECSDGFVVKGLPLSIPERPEQIEESHERYEDEDRLDEKP